MPFLLLPLWFAAVPPEIREIKIDAAAGRVQPNLVPNFSFEQTRNGLPVGWTWDRRNTDATLTIDDCLPHNGRRSIRVRNNTPRAAHVFGSLWTDPPIRVSPDTQYTLSFYARSENPGYAWVGGGQDWRVRISIPSTKGRWQRYSKSFRTNGNEESFVLRINTDSPTPNLWIDDVKLEEGNVATFCRLPEGDPGPVLDDPEWPTVLRDGPWTLQINLFSAEANGQINVTLTQGDHVSSLQPNISIPAGLSTITITGQADQPTDEPCTLTVDMRDERRAVTKTRTFRFLSIRHAMQRLDDLENIGRRLNELVEQAKRQGIDPAYPLVGTTVVNDFIQYVRADLDHGAVERAYHQLRQLESMADRTRAQLKAALDGTIALPRTPRYVTSEITIDGPSFLAQTRDPVGGRTAHRPVFFTGYGHFGQVLADLEKFPGYGVNIMQVEFGPNSVFPEEGVVSDETIKTYLSAFDRAAQAGVAICLLISPHYMPSWVVEKYPELNVTRKGFIQYCPHAPAGQAFLQRFIQFLIPRIKDHPALHSICLSNEPVNAESSDCIYAQKAWHHWLRQRHNSIDTLNRRWQTDYPSIDEVPLPEARVEPTPQAYDFVLFNQEWFAGWHAMMADAIHEIAPDLPVHAKTMTWNFLSSSDQRYGVNAELFGTFSQIHGNDSINYYGFGMEKWAQRWQLNNMGHDLQRSVADLPVFNSENHIIRDRETRPNPPGHVRTALWQAAVHGQSATTIWVWSRTYDPKSDFAGSIMHRPACAEAVGHTGLDLLRLSNQVRALQRLAPQVGLLYSTAAMVYDGASYVGTLNRAYTALSFTGLKIGFVTERQLIAGQGGRPPVLFVPNVRRLPEKAFRALANYSGRIILIGSDPLLDRDAYDQPRTQRLTGPRVESIPDAPDEQQLWETMLKRFPIWNIKPEVSVTRPDGSPVWGVEWLVARYEDRPIINLIQHGKQPETVLLRYEDKPLHTIDLFENAPMDAQLTLRPLEPRLLVGK